MTDQSGSTGGGWARPDDERPTEIVSAGSGHDGLAEQQTVVLTSSALAPRRRRGLVAGVGALALALVAAGGVYAYSLLSGGGAQPEKYVPANAIAFVKLDLDPAAEQKISALRFFRHFPGGSEALQGDDVREIIFDLLQKGDDDLAQLDFDKDIAPWLGDRLAVAVLPPESAGEQPEVLGVLQVKDQVEARKGLPKLLDGGDSPAMVFTGGYALLAEDEATATAARDAAAEANLGDDKQFRADLEPFGDNVAAFWVNLKAVGDQIESSPGSLDELTPEQADLFEKSFQGRVAGAVTFDASHADLSVHSVGTSALGTPAADSKPVGPWLSSVPESTLVALGISGLDQTVRAIFNSLPPFDTLGFNLDGDDGSAAVEPRDRLRMPDDIITLLGHRTLITVDSYLFQNSMPQGVVLRAETDADAAGRVLEKLQTLLRQSDAPVELAWQQSGSDMLVGLSPDDLSAATSGTGVSDPAFQEALPNLESAQEAVWVDLDAIVEAILAQAPESIDSGTADVLSHVAGIGLTASFADDSSTATLRVVAD
jgi:hypothetical protein